VCFDFLYNFCLKRRSERDVIQNVYWSSCKLPVILVRFWCYLSSLFLNNTQISNFMKIRRVWAELFYADRRTDMTLIIVSSRNSANVPKNGVVLTCFQKDPLFFSVPRLWGGGTNSLDLPSLNLPYSCNAFPYLVLTCISL